MRVLLVDDEPYYYKLLEKPLKAAGHELVYARNGKEALALLASNGTDIIILDLRLPDLSGYEILSRIRRDQRFSHVPVIVITVDNDLDDKLKAFEYGADDYLVKPFQPEELVARLRILGQRGKALKIVQEMETHNVDVSTMVAVHSLRGGVGCSSIAVNLAIAYHQLWERRTVIVDAVLTAGQVAMMLDTSPRVTWEHFVGVSRDAIEEEDYATLLSPHKSGVFYVASPKTPVAMDAFTEDFWQASFQEFKKRNEFIVVDLAHDLSDMTIQILNQSSWILLVLAPEIGSLRAAASALDVYDRLGMDPNKIKLVLNRTSNTGIQQPKLEKVLERPFDFVLPYEPVEVRRALDFGIPFIVENPELPICAQLENIAYELSDDLFKNLPPAVPSPTWKRVNKRLNIAK